jgi:hypothetical protein
LGTSLSATGFELLTTYSSFDDYISQVSELMIKHLEPLLYKYRVNLGFYGHNHVVQRHGAVYQKQVVQHSSPRVDDDGNTIYVHENPQATVHWIVGTGGADFTVTANDPKPAWNEVIRTMNLRCRYGTLMLFLCSVTFSGLLLFVGLCQGSSV